MSEPRGNSTPRLEAAVAVLRQGGIIAYPTETVFGLGCLPDYSDALHRLLHIKRRSGEKGLILIGATPAHFADFVALLGNSEWQTIMTPAARPTSWIVPAAARVSPVLTGTRATIALRVTTSPTARALCLMANTALVSTSANLSGEAPARSARDLMPSLRRQVDLVIEGDCTDAARPSRIVDLRSGAILRE